MDTKICTKCSYEKDIRAFKSSGKDRKKSSCYNCNSGSSRERFYYPTEELEELSKKMSIVYEKKNRRSDYLRKQVIRICPQCSANNILKYHQKCFECVRKNKREKYRRQDKRKQVERINSLKEIYLRRLLKNSADFRGYNVRSDDIPEELIELKRLELKLKRDVKKKIPTKSQ